MTDDKHSVDCPAGMNYAAWQRRVQAEQAQGEVVQDFAETAQGHDLDPGYQAGLRRAVEIVRAQEQTFLSPEYATGQPLSSMMERFACKQIAAAIEAEIEGS